MTEQSKVLPFPGKAKRVPAPKTDGELFRDIERARRRLERVIDNAKRAGLDVDVSDGFYRPFNVTRTYNI